MKNISIKLIEKIFNNSPVSTIITDFETHKFLLVNKEFTKHSGYTLKDVSDKTIDELNIFVNQDDLLRIRKKLKNHKSVKNEVVQLQKKNGDVIICFISAEVVEYECRPAVLCYAIDITDKAKIIRKKELMELAVESSLTLSNMIVDSTMEEVIQFGLNKIIEITKSEMGYFHLINENFTIWSNETLKSCSLVNNNHSLMNNAGIWTDCYHKRKPIIHNDYNSESHKKELPEGHISIIRDLAIPITFNKQIEAILGVINKKTKYTRLDVDITKLIAENIWKTIQIQKANKAVENERDKWKSLFNYMPTGYTLHKMIFDEKGNPIDFIFVEQNAASIKILNDIRGIKFSEWKKDDEFDFVSQYSKVLNSDKTIKFEQYSTTLNRWYSIIAYSPLENHFVTIFEDITEVKEERQQYQTIVELLPVAIVIYDIKTNHIKFANSKTYKLLGYTDYKEVTKLKANDIVHPDFRDIVKKRQKEIIEKQEIAEPLIEKFIRKDGSLIDVEVTAKPISYKGRPSILVIFQDVSEKISLEEQLRQAAKLEAIGLLAGGVAHDFNNILTVIHGYSEIIYNKIKNNKGWCDYAYILPRIQKIKNSSVRATKLTKQLLAFSRKQILDPEIIDLNDLIIEERESLHKLIREEIELSYILEKNIGKILIDVHEIQNIIMNLIINSSDAIEGVGNIIIETRNVYFDEHHDDVKKKIIKPGSFVMLAITDNGCGMNKETIKRIFEPFFTTKGLGKGYGLGLSTVYGIVKQSGGYIWVESEVNKGTTFRLYFPRISDKIAYDKKGDLQKKLTDEHVGNYTGNEIIFVVEDEREVREMIIETLKDYGYKVISAPNGIDAIEIIHREKVKPDLLLTDVVMPKMNGKELAIKIKELIPDIKVVYMSGYTDDTIVHKGILDTETHFIQKPITPIKLVDKVKHALNE